MRLSEPIKKKIIIAIQETHQLSMHHGVVNNLIFSVDIIFAASDLEKKTLDQLQPNAKIYSIGWLFQNGYREFISSLYQPSNLRDNQTCSNNFFSSHQYNCLKQRIFPSKKKYSALFEQKISKFKINN